MNRDEVAQNDIEWIKKYMTEMRTEMNTQHSQILAQTTKTNGRVTKLEDELQELDKNNAVFQTRVYTIGGVISIIGSFLTTIFFKIF